MVSYYGVNTKALVGALQDSLDLLTVYSPGPATKTAVEAFRADRTLEKLASEKDPAAFATLLHASGLSPFMCAAGQALECHAHLDTDGKGKEAYKVLTSITGFASSAFHVGHKNKVNDDAFHESFAFAGGAYAEKYLKSQESTVGKVRLTVASFLAFRRLREDPREVAMAETMNKLLPATTRGDIQSYVSNGLMKMDILTCLNAVDHLARKCGFDPNGDDVRGKRPMRNYYAKFDIPAGSDPAYTGAIMTLQKQICDFAKGLSTTTEVSTVGHGIEGAALQEVAWSLKDPNQPKEVKMGSGSCRLDVHFTSTEGAAQKVADAFPDVNFRCIETKKTVAPTSQIPPGAYLSLPY